MDLQQTSDHDGSEAIKPFGDQLFLLHFIMGTYLGPDVTSDHPRSSAFVREAKGSPPYGLTDLGPSYVSVAMLEKLYYYVLRKAGPSLILKPITLHKYLNGSLHLKCGEETWQFTRLFPPNLHEQIWYPASFRVIKGIVLIDEPVPSHLQQKDLDKFKSLSCTGNLKVDLNEILSFDLDLESNSLNGSNYPSVRSKQKCPKRHEPLANGIQCNEQGDFKRKRISISDAEHRIMESYTSIVASGTARTGKASPPVGALDIGASKKAYYFRVALPGVRKDYSKFSCEVQYEGKINIQGLTSGGKTIHKPNRVFEMSFQQLCPPGPFTLSFSLPGPVDPRLFAPNFRSDGIFEGVIMKHTKDRT